MNTPTLESLALDIPENVARAAHNGTSFTPERRGEQEIAGYASSLLADWQMLSKYADTDDKQNLLAAEFRNYRSGMRQRTIAYLSARSRCMSTMITGGSNFPTARNAKRNSSADKRLAELIDYRETCLDAIRKLLRPELRPIMAGDSDATKRLADKLAGLEKLQEHMRTVNATIRAHAKDGTEAQVAALVALGVHEGTAKDLIAPDFMGRIGYADYQLKNNGAEIRRLKARLEVVAEAQATPAEEIEGATARLEDSPADNRVRLYFPGKPDERTRSRLKSSGFRWAPSLGCWQAYRNPRSIEIAKREAGVEEQTL